MADHKLLRKPCPPFVSQIHRILVFLSYLVSAQSASRFSSACSFFRVFLRVPSSSLSLYFLSWGNLIHSFGFNLITWILSIIVTFFGWLQCAMHCTKFFMQCTWFIPHNISYTLTCLTPSCASYTLTLRDVNTHMCPEGPLTLFQVQQR